MAIRVFFSYAGKQKKFVDLLYETWKSRCQKQRYVWYYNYLDKELEKQDRKLPDHLMESRSANLIFVVQGEGWLMSDNCPEEYRSFCEYLISPCSYNIVCLEKDGRDEWSYFLKSKKANPLPEVKPIHQYILDMEDEDWVLSDSDSAETNRRVLAVAIKLNKETEDVLKKYEEKIENNYYIVSTETSHPQLDNYQKRYQSFLYAHLSKNNKKVFISPSALRVTRLISPGQSYTNLVSDEYFSRKSKNLIIIHPINASGNANTIQLNEFIELGKDKKFVILLNKPENWNSYLSDDKTTTYFFVTIEEFRGLDLDATNALFLSNLKNLLSARYEKGDPTKIFKYLFLNNENIQEDNSKNKVNDEVNALNKVIENMKIEDISEAFTMIKFLSHDLLTQKEFDDHKSDIGFTNLQILNQEKYELRNKILDSIEISIKNRDGSNCDNIIVNEIRLVIKEILLFNNSVKK